MDEIHVILEDILLHEYREVVEIRSLVPEDHWERYELLEITDLRECLLLKQVQENLRKSFQKRVFDYGKKAKTRGQEDQTNSK